MRKGYKIVLFFVCFLAAVFALLLIWERYTWKMRLPEKIVRQQTQESLEGGAVSSSQKNIRTTCDTLCIYEDIDKKDGTVVLSEEKIPEKYIDMTRSELEKVLYEDNRRGFPSQHLELFSEDKIKIVRIYDTAEKNGYYIMAADDEVWIYKGDKKTLYFKTELVLDDLPPKVRAEVIEGKYMDSEVKVYHFLESYSS